MEVEKRDKPLRDDPALCQSYSSKLFGDDHEYPAELKELLLKYVRSEACVLQVYEGDG